MTCSASPICYAKRRAVTFRATLSPVAARRPVTTITTANPNCITPFAGINPGGFSKGKRPGLAGIGADGIRLLQARAAMRKASPPKPYLREPVSLDLFPLELFFDVEVDPLRGICYLHGFVERKN